MPNVFTQKRRRYRAHAQKIRSSAVPGPLMITRFCLNADQALIGSRSTSTRIDADRRTSWKFRRATQICPHAKTEFAAARAISGVSADSRGSFEFLWTQ